jgi:hypothetical protein
MKSPTVFIVDKEYKADYNVCFVEKSIEEKNTGLIRNGQMVPHEYEAEKKLYIVDHEDLADIKIMRENFPS